MLSDIKLSNGDIVFGVDDLELVYDNDSIQQNISLVLQSSPGTWFYDPLLGSSILSFIQSPRDYDTKLSIEQDIIIILSKDPNIITNTISITIEDTQDLVVSISFYTTLNNDIVSLTYSQNINL